MTMMTDPINLSFSRSDTFCGMQVYYRDVQKAKWEENFYTAIGKICESGVNAELSNRMTGVQGRGIREEMQRTMEDLLPRASSDEVRDRIRGEFEAATTSVAYYIKTIDYEPRRVQEWFSWTIDGHDNNPHPVRGCIDVLAYRGGRPLVVDLKRKSAAMKADNYGYRMQLSLYCLWLMQAWELDDIPDAEIHVMLSGKAPQIWPVKVTVEDIYETIYRLKDLGWRLTNSYFPMARGHKLCSKMWCMFYERCHIENFQTLPEMLKEIRP